MVMTRMRSPGLHSLLLIAAMSVGNGEAAQRDFFLPQPSHQEDSVQVLDGGLTHWLQRLESFENELTQAEKNEPGSRFAVDRAHRQMTRLKRRATNLLGIAHDYKALRLQVKSLIADAEKDLQSVDYDARQHVHHVNGSRRLLQLSAGAMPDYEREYAIVMLVLARFMERHERRYAKTEVALGLIQEMNRLEGRLDLIRRHLQRHSHELRRQLGAMS